MKLQEMLDEHWGDLSTTNLETIGEKFFGDRDAFFQAGETLSSIILNTPEEDIARPVMSVLAGIIKIAYDRGRESVTQ